MYLPWHNTDLGSRKEVHFKQPGLQMIFGWSVVLKGIQKERSTCLNLVCFHKYIYNLKIAKEQFEKRMLGVITEEWIWSMLSRCSPKPVPNLICYENLGKIVRLINKCFWYLSLFKVLGAFHTCKLFITDLTEICECFSFFLDKHWSKLTACFWIDSHHIPKKEDVIWSIANLLGI